MTDLRPQRVRWVDSLRGIAALSVAWFHLYTQNGGELLRAHVPELLNHTAVVGRYGVELFFVISGFVLALTLLPRTDIRTGKDVGLYFVRRSVRLDPPYLVVLALYVAAYPMFARAEVDTGVDPTMSLERLVSSIFYFLPRRANLYIPVAWTLAIEVQFYLLFAAMVLTINRLSRPVGERWRAMMLVIAAMLAVASLPRLGLLRSVDQGFWMLPHLSSFAVGVTAAMVAMRIRGAAWLFAAGLAIVLYGAVTAGGRPLAALIFGLALIPVLISQRLQRWLENPVLLFLGAVSYCVYLMHPLVGSILVEWIQTWAPQPGYPQILVVAAGVLATIAAAAAVRQAVEKPAIAWSKKVTFGSPAEPRPAPIGPAPAPVDPA